MLTELLRACWRGIWNLIQIVALGFIVLGVLALFLGPVMGGV